MVPAARLGRYEVLAKLAAGGMGEIFLARLEGAAGFEKLYVIKKILPHLAGDLRFRQMMIGEASIASKMSHANVSQIYELDEIDGQLYIAMEYLEGVTALALLRKAARKKEPLDVGLIAGVVTQVCDGLHYAHELKDRDGSPLKVVHRDVTPSNVFITDNGLAKLLDFGIAKVENVASTESGAIKGKYAYMAPEQLRGLEIDRRVDIFAVGILMFELLALRRLFQRKTDYLTFQAVLEQPLRDVRQYRPDAPDAVIAVMKKCLSAEPSERYDNTRQLRSALLAAIGVPAWGPHEISDFVHANFDEDIARRRTSVASAARRDGGATMPVIWSAGSADPDEDDEYFIGASLSGMSAKAIHAAAATLENARPNITAPTKVDRIRPPTEPRGVPTRMPTAPARSKHKSMVAALGLCIAATVAAIVVVMTTRSSPPAREPKPAPSDPIALALYKNQSELDRCAHQGSAKLPQFARANVFVEPDGKVYDVALEPATSNDSEIGRCVRDRLKAMAFPAGPSRTQIVIALTQR
jgi:serine/threonine-protein kinase